MPRHNRFTRRTALKLGAAAAALPLVHIRTGGAAGKVSIGFWDHWVPGGNDVMQKQVDAWAEKNKVEVQVDFITSTGNKLQLTGAAEAQAKTGHDALAFFNWDVYNVADALEPIDDVMQRLIAKNGAVDADVRVSGQGQGPLGRGADQLRHADQAAVRAHQLVQAARPRRAGDVSGEARSTPRCRTPGPGTRSPNTPRPAQKDGMTFGLGMGGGGNTDATDTHGALFKAFGADADRRRRATSSSSPTRCARCWSSPRSW